jgi:hypothetical protein
MDRGMTSAANLAWLQQTGRRYLLGTAKSELRKWARAIAEAHDWQRVREGVEAKLCAGPDGQETFVLCRSVERRESRRCMRGLPSASSRAWISSAGASNMRAGRSTVEN